MPRSRIQYQEHPHRAIFTFRLPGGWFAPQAWLWSAVGGVALGILAALALTVLDVVDPDGASRLSFRAALIGGTIAGTLVLYLGVYIGAARARLLRVTFDYRRKAVMVRLPDTGRRPTRFALTDVIAFRLVEEAGCKLIMETTGRGPVALVTTRHACHDPRCELPRLAGYLAAHLDPARDTSDDIPPLPARDVYEPD